MLMRLLMQANEAGVDNPAAYLKDVIFLGVFVIVAIVVFIWWLRR